MHVCKFSVYFCCTQQSGTGDKSRSGKIQDYQTRMNMMFKGQSCVDGKGVKRLVKKINNLFI